MARDHASLEEQYLSYIIALFGEMAKGYFEG